MEYILFYLAFGYAIIATIALVIYITRYNNVQKSQDILIKENMSFLNKFEEQEEMLRQKECAIHNQSVLFEDNKLFISSLNERVQKAEAEKEQLIKSKKILNDFCIENEQREIRNRETITELKENLNEEKEQNMLLVDELKELRLKLSRKGTGTKGSKKIFDIGCDLASRKDQSVTYIQILGDEDMSKYYGCEFAAMTHGKKLVTGYIFEDSGVKVNNSFMLVTRQEYIYGYIGFTLFDGCFGIKYIPNEFIDNGYFCHYANHSTLHILFQSFSIVKRG